MRVGAVLSTTVIVAMHCAVLLPGSVAVIVTMFGPVPRAVPGGGVCVSVKPQASVAVTCGRKSGSVAVQPLPAINVWFVAHCVIIGGIVSCTVTVKLQELLLPLASVATHDTVVRPIGNRSPEFFEHTSTAPGSQMSE